MIKSVWKYRGQSIGLLATKAAKRLGAVSYSLYLTQGLILFPLSQVISKDDVSHTDYKVITLFVSAYISICLLSSLTYHFVERPFIKSKKASLSKLILLHNLWRPDAVAFFILS